MCLSKQQMITHLFLAMSGRAFIIKRCSKINFSITNRSISLPCLISFITYKKIQTNSVFLKNLSWMGLSCGMKGMNKDALTEDVKVYLTYSSFEICWCAWSQPSLNSSWLDEKHFYWALLGGQLPLCVCVCLIFGKTAEQQGMLPMSGETLLLSRLT